VAREYEVGYGRPPKATRFKKGQSGNPWGRPKKKLTPDELEKKMLWEDSFIVRINGKIQRVNAVTAVLNVLLGKALAGDQRAIAEILRRADAHRASVAEEQDPHVAGANLIIEALKNTFCHLHPSAEIDEETGSPEPDLEMQETPTPEQSHDNSERKKAIS